MGDRILTDKDLVLIAGDIGVKGMKMIAVTYMRMTLDVMENLIFDSPGGQFQLSR